MKRAIRPFVVEEDYETKRAALVAKTALQANARQLVARAAKSGALKREPCEVCGAREVDAHHEDYAFPLNVIWLCRLHHRWLHAYGKTVEQMQASCRRKAAEAAA